VDFIRAVAALSLELGHDPSAIEIARKLGITRQGAAEQLRAIEAKGLLADVPVTVSSGKWRLTDAARRWLP
jgi:predicted ArsR family transcriptional regulator